MFDRLMVVRWLGVLALITATPVLAEAVQEALEAQAREMCGGCHGAGGQGDNPVFPKLAGEDVDYLLGQMQRFRQGVRRGAVMNYHLANMSEAAVVRLAQFFATQRRRPDVAVIGNPPGAGRALFELGDPARGITACANCHGAVGGAPVLKGQHAGYLADQLFRFAESRRQSGQTMVHPAPLPMERGELSELSRYLATLVPPGR